MLTPQPHVELVQVTPNAEINIAYIARVSNPSGQTNPDYAKLLRYCIQHQHWSIFEHATMTLEITTSLAIATQILRHRSFTFQQFSQRYANPFGHDPLAMQPIHLRRQDQKNRQASHDDLPPEVVAPFLDRIAAHLAAGRELYRDLINSGVARECARFVLPQATTTRLYVTGNVRSWIHYIQLRSHASSQLEHREVALKCREHFIRQFPTVAAALDWLGPKGDPPAAPLALPAPSKRKRKENS
jgi:thymidylate synthase (FAD)